MRCAFHSELAVGTISESALERAERDHLFKVLRAGKGDSLILIDGRGNRASAEIAENRSIQVESLQRIAEPRVKLHLYVAPPRRRKMDDLLRQCSEIGVWRVVPILTERGVSIPDNSSSFDRMRKQLVEGCKQSNNPFLPELLAPIPFPDSLRIASESCDRLFFGAVEPVCEHAISPLRDFRGNSLNVAWFVGPEGGFAPTELDALRAAGNKPLNLGSWILRIETAAVVGAALLINALSDKQMPS